MSEKSTKRYIEVPADEFISYFEEKNFQKRMTGKEVVMRFDHKIDPRVKIQIYTSIAVNAQDARGCGEDAIRINAVFETFVKGEMKVYPLYKGKRVYRTGSVEKVLSRTRKEALNAYERGTEWLKQQALKSAEWRKNNA